MVSGRRTLKTNALLFAALFALAACVHGAKLQPTSSDEGKSGVEKSFSLLTDIPIPPESALNVERSLILGDLDRWTGRIVLNVGKDAPPTFAVYQTQMPNFGWSPIMSVQAEISVLSFTRGERAATVQIEGRTLGGSIATITVAPRQSVTSPSVGAGANVPVQVTPVR